MRVLIIYHTRTGHTRRAAEDIADGMSATRVTPCLLAARKIDTWDLSDVGGVVVGSPCHCGSVRLGGGVAGAVRAVLDRLEPGMLEGCPAGAFSVHSVAGAGATVRTIEGALAAAGARIVVPGIVVRAGVPFSVCRGPMAGLRARQQLRAFGKAIGETVLHDG